jgi:pyruvate formate lyase activating enzyme
MIPAHLAQSLPDGVVQCGLCPHGCRLAEGQNGVCRVRGNRGGILYSFNSDRVAALHVDPIEKKPLYHFLPGSRSFSLAAMGCNLACRFCQNHHLSVVFDPASVRGEPLPPAELVKAAVDSRCASISYTYTEPTVFFELMRETAILARERGLRNVMVSNGFMSAAALADLAPWLDAANIDLKSFSDEFYRRYCNARLQPVLDTIAEMRRRSIWVEVTTLLIPGLNTSAAELGQLASFLVSIDAKMPWHVSRFFPQHEMQELEPTAEADIHLALRIGGESGLSHLYSGNLERDEWSDTICSNCGTTLIRRQGYRVACDWKEPGKCPACGAAVAGIWS